MRTITEQLRLLLLSGALTIACNIIVTMARFCLEQHDPRRTYIIGRVTEGRERMRAALASA